MWWRGVGAVGLLVEGRSGNDLGKISFSFHTPLRWNVIYHTMPQLAHLSFTKDERGVIKDTLGDIMEILWDRLLPRTTYSQMELLFYAAAVSFQPGEKLKSSIWHSLFALSCTRLTATWTRPIKTRVDVDWSLQEVAGGCWNCRLF